MSKVLHKDVTIMIYFDLLVQCVLYIIFRLKCYALCVVILVNYNLKAADLNYLRVAKH